MTKTTTPAFSNSNSNTTITTTVNVTQFGTTTTTTTVITNHIPLATKLIGKKKSSSSSELYSFLTRSRPISWKTNQAQVIESKIQIRKSSTCSCKKLKREQDLCCSFTKPQLFRWRRLALSFEPNNNLFDDSELNLQTRSQKAIQWLEKLHSHFSSRQLLLKNDDTPSFIEPYSTTSTFPHWSSDIKPLIPIEAYLSWDELVHLVQHKGQSVTAYQLFPSIKCHPYVSKYVANPHSSKNFNFSTISTFDYLFQKETISQHNWKDYSYSLVNVNSDQEHLGIEDAFNDTFPPKTLPEFLVSSSKTRYQTLYIREEYAKFFQSIKFQIL